MNADSVAKKKPEWRIIVEMLEKVDLVLLNRIMRRMIYYLYTSNVKDISELMKELETTEEGEDEGGGLYANVPHPKIDLTSLRQFTEKVFQLAEETIFDEEIARQIGIWLAQERSRFLSMALENINISLVEIKDVLNRFMNIPENETYLSPHDLINTRVALIRRFLSNTLRYINVAKHHILIRDFHEILKNTMGSARSSGKLGGKSAGLILGYKILNYEKQHHPQLKNVLVPKSWYITSDTILEFIHYNALEEITSLKYMDIEQIRAGYPYLQQLFKNSFFPADIVEQLEIMLQHIGDKPIIVRSSSLLEDSFQATFSGKYKSLFLSNRGSKAQRINALLDAIAEIFASIFGPDPIEYRKERGLLDFQEEMGILIQEVVGTQIGKYFFPTFAGVAFSNNDFRWSPRIEQQDGMVRIVAGLGTRAVDRVGNDYPFLASPGKPGLKVNIDPEDILKYSQRYIDVLNLEANKFETLPIDEVFRDLGNQIPGLDKVISIYQHGTLSPPLGVLWDCQGQELLVTFQKLTESSPFLAQMHLILNILKDAFETAVDVEFAADGERLYILQCRPQSQGKTGQPICLPEKLNNDQIIFQTNKYVTPGYISGIKTIIYVDPEAYQALPNRADMKQVAAIISQLNQVMPAKKFILIGPGRWGSRGDIKLGVQVAYSDINKTAMLIEMAYSKDGYVPELSFGTHFFQDLVEADIKYLPIYPDEVGNFFNRDIFLDYDNQLLKWVPDAGLLTDVVKVIDIDQIKENSVMNVIMDSTKNQAIGFIETAGS
jgi:hypothetical protein